MTTGKAQIQSLVKQKMQTELTEQNIGLQVVNITVQDAEPPTDEIVRAFKAVETAKQGKETAVNNANRYRNESLPIAEAEADKIIQQAEAAKEARIAEAEGQVSRFEKMYDEYVKYPNITRQRLYYEAIERILPGQRIIISDGNTEQLLPVGSFTDQETAGAQSQGSLTGSSRRGTSGGSFTDSNSEEGGDYDGE